MKCEEPNSKGLNKEATRNRAPFRLFVLLLAVLMNSAFSAPKEALAATGNDLVAVAEQQLGNGPYKYRKHFGRENTSDSWCHYFVSWCAAQVGIEGSCVPHTGRCADGVSWYIDHPICLWKAVETGYVPKAGDIVYFHNNSGSNTSAFSNHVGIVTGCSNGKVYTIEGNTHSKVERNGGGSGYPMDGSAIWSNQTRIVGYGCWELEPNPDTNPPTISDLRVGEINGSTFTTMAKVTDNVGVASVRYAVWTERGGQDDLIWYEGHCTDGNDVYWAHIPYSEHNNEKGTYIVHCYAYDAAGNVSSAGVTQVFESEPPVISEVKVVSITPDGYRVGCTVTDNVGVTTVKFPTWVTSQGQNGGNAIWKDYTYKHDNYYAFDVKVSDHNDWHGIYSTHIYAYDAAGNVAASGIPVSVPVPVKMTNNGGSTYYLFEDGLSWTDAEKRCENAYGGGHLVVISSAAEQEAVAALAQAGGRDVYWIGASDKEAEGSWKWVTGDTFDSYSNWSSGEPNGGMNENYLGLLRSNGKWDDRASADEDLWVFGYIMEVDGGAFERQGEVVTIEDGIYSINMFANDGYVVEIAGGAMEVQGNAQLYQANGTDAQRWQFIKNDDDTYTITNVKSGLALDVEAAAQGSNANVWQHTPNGTAAQRWYVERDSSGAYFLRAKCSNCYLDVAGYSFSNGANMITWYANGNNQQKFKLTKAGHAKAVNQRVTDVTPEGYTVEIEFETPGESKFAEVKQVLCPTWTPRDGQGDILWQPGTVEGDKVTYVVKASDHNGESGTRYATDVYFYDGYGQSYCIAGVRVFVPGSEEVIASLGTSTYYLVEDEPLAWADAKSRAESKYFNNRGTGSHLVTIGSAEEQAVVAELVSHGSMVEYWIGASDADDEGVWSWVTGETLGGYDSWDDGEPNGGSEENYAVMYGSTGLWNDEYAEAYSVKDVGYVVEVEGEDRCGPEFGTVTVTDLNETGYTVTAVLRDPSGINKVSFATWVPGEGETGSDALWEDGTLYKDPETGDFVAEYRVSTADHDGSTGAYATTVWGYDGLLNLTKHKLYTMCDITVPDAAYATDEAVYYRFDQGLTWTEAQAQVGASPIEGLKLATVASETENDALASLLAGADKSAYWLGLADADGTGEPGWVDGTKMGYAHWAKGQPGSYEGARYGAVLTSNGKWYAYADSGANGRPANMGYVAMVGVSVPELPEEPVYEDGWVDLPGGKKGYAVGGKLVTGWLDVGSGKHWFGEDGIMATGWTDVEVGGKVMHYYFNPASGNLVRGTWFQIDGRTYYFRPSGNLATGWATISDNGVDKKYYFEEDGTLVKGTWKDIVNDNGVTNHYYFRPSGAMATGWAEIGGEQHFFRPSGNMATGFTSVPDDAYKRYFDESGRMLTGWQQIGGKTYYFRASGAMQTGWKVIGGNTYWFRDSGSMQTGTKVIDGVEYVFNDEGVLVSGELSAAGVESAVAESPDDSTDGVETMISAEDDGLTESDHDTEAEQPSGRGKAEEVSAPTDDGNSAEDRAIESSLDDTAPDSGTDEHEVVLGHRATDTLSKGSSGTCQWSITKDGELLIAPMDGASIGTLQKPENKEWNQTEDVSDLGWGWLAPELSACITKVTIKSGTQAGESIYGLLANLENLEFADLSGLDVSQTHDFTHLFDGCVSLRQINLCGWDIAQIECADDFVAGCNSLESVKVMEGFDEALLGVPASCLAIEE